MWQEFQEVISFPNLPGDISFGWLKGDIPIHAKDVLFAIPKLWGSTQSHPLEGFHCTDSEWINEMV